MGANGGVYDFPVLEIGDVFGINIDLRINPNSIPDTDAKSITRKWKQFIDIVLYKIFISALFVTKTSLCTSKTIDNWQKYSFICLFLQLLQTVEY